MAEEAGTADDVCGGAGWAGSDAPGEGACDTVAPPEPLSAREMAVRGGIGLLVAAALLGISALFVDYPKLWRQVTATVEPTKVAVNEGAFSPYFQLDVTGLDRKTGMLQISVTRRAGYPLTDAALDALYEHPPEILATTEPAATQGAATSTSKPAEAMGLLRRHLAVEALGRGMVTLEYRDAGGKYMGRVEMRWAS